MFIKRRKSRVIFYCETFLNMVLYQQERRDVSILDVNIKMEEILSCQKK